MRRLIQDLHFLKGKSASGVPCVLIYVKVLALKKIKQSAKELAQARAVQAHAIQKHNWSNWSLTPRNTSLGTVKCTLKSVPPRGATCVSAIGVEGHCVRAHKRALHTHFASRVLRSTLAVSLRTSRCVPCLHSTYGSGYLPRYIK